MDQRKVLWKRIVATLTFFLVSLAHAGIPVWTYKPLTNTSLSVPANGTAVIQYLVTNQSTHPHTLAMPDLIPGITAVASDCDPSCQGSFCLPKLGSTCTLSLNIDGSQIAANIAQEPIFCDQGNRLMCYGPSQPINITRSVAQVAVGGTIIGLAGDLTLLLNGANPLTTNNSGSYSFATTLPVGSPYQVTIASKPALQTCTLTSNAEGTITAATDITDIDITCVSNADAFTLGGTISKPTGTGPISLSTNGQEINTDDSVFTFPQPIAEGTAYDITISSNSPDLFCDSPNSSGVMGNAPINDIVVTCNFETFPVSGTINNLNGSVTLEMNDQIITKSTNSPTNVDYIFPDPVPKTTPYEVTVSSVSVGQHCECVSNCSGSVNQPINSIINCEPIPVTTLSDVKSTIPVTSSGSSTNLITIQNTGSNPAHNVRIQLPIGWSAAVATPQLDCLLVQPNQECHISVSSTLPYIATSNTGSPSLEKPYVLADNLSGTPKVALAFTIQDFLVWQIGPGNISQVIDNDDFLNVPWDTSDVPVGADSLNNGFGNTQLIVSQLSAPNAALTCYNSLKGGAPQGAWYLPAICQLGVYTLNKPPSPPAVVAPCDKNMANINSNLVVNKDFGNLTYPFPSGTPFFFWSSTEDPQQPATQAWLESYPINPNGSNGLFQNPFPKSTLQRVRCARTLPIPP